MDMKDRVDNFLKVSEERMNNDVHDRELQRQLIDLCGELTELIKDPDEQNRLHDGFVKAQANARIAAWDERFLNVVAGEYEGVELDRLDRLTHQVSQGRMRPRMGAPIISTNGTTGMTLAAPHTTSATWSSVFEDGTPFPSDPSWDDKDEE